MATAEQETQDIQADGEAPEPPPIDNHDAETLRRIVELNRNVAAAQAKYDRADRARKATKEALEEEQAILNEFIAGLDEELPLFDRKPDGEAPADDTSSSWRSVHIEKLADFGLPGPLIGILVEAGITSVGAVADWTLTKPLTEIAGVGQAKAEKIADALEAFWRERGDAEVLAGVKEAEAGPAPPPWRAVVVGELGLAEATVELLDEHVIPTVGELVALLRNPPAWLDDVTLLDIDAGLTRFRHRRSNAEIEDFDVAMGWEEPVKPKAKRGRKASA
jgi:hypothetical protein